MYLTFCLLQDILTKEITGHGTKRGGLYYMDHFCLGKANQIESTASTKSERSGYGISGWGTHHLVI